MLSQTVFHTDAFDPSDRVEAWQECMATTIAPLEVRPGTDGSADSRKGAFTAHQRLVRLDSISIWPMSTDACRYVRTKRMIRHSDPELYHLTLLLPGSGTLWTRHAGHQVVHQPDSLYFVDTSLPCEVASRDALQPVKAIGVEIPARLLRGLGRKTVAPVMGRALSAEGGFGLLLAQFLTRLDAGRDTFHPSDVPRLNSVLLDLVSGLIARETDAGLSVETRERHLELRVRAHINDRLHDPELTVASVAAAHHLSIRQLHRVFQEGDATVAGYIRAQRLERARAQLADPSRSAASVHAIAAQCGFTSQAHFSRLFRATFGATPTEYRRESHVASAEVCQ